MSCKLIWSAELHPDVAILAVIVQRRVGDRVRVGIASGTPLARPSGEDGACRFCIDPDPSWRC